MTVELKPETERLVREELRRGQLQSFDEVIVEGIYALREKIQTGILPAAGGRSRKSIYDLLTQPPFAGSGLDLERQRDDCPPA